MLTVLSLIQGFAFNYWANQLNGIYGQVRAENYVVGVHFILCFVILIRVYQTFMAAVLDYDFLLPRSFEMLLISTVGVAEFFLFSSIGEDRIINFNSTSFHKRGILLCLMAALGYTIVLWRLVKQREDGAKRNLIPFKTTTRKGREHINKRGGKFQMIRAGIGSLRLITYKKPENYSQEVLLQEVNIASLLVIIAIEFLIVLSKPGRHKLISLVVVIMAILCSNVFYSTRITFGRREKSSKPLLS